MDVNMALVVTAPTCAGMQTAIMSWPRILTPTEVEDIGAQMYQQMRQHDYRVEMMMPPEVWREYHTRGYAWQSAQLMELWGFNNKKLIAALLAGER